MAEEDGWEAASDLWGNRGEREARTAYMSAFMAGVAWERERIRQLIHAPQGRPAHAAEDAGPEPGTGEFTAARTPPRRERVGSGAPTASEAAYEELRAAAPEALTSRAILERLRRKTGSRPGAQLDNTVLKGLRRMREDGRLIFEDGAYRLPASPG